MSNKPTIKLKDYDPIDFLESPEDMASYIDAAIQENDAGLLISALNDVARAYGVNKLAEEIGVNRESLYKSLNGSVMPRFDTIYKALNVLGLQMSVKPIQENVR